MRIREYSFYCIRKLLKEPFYRFICSDFLAVFIELLSEVWVC